MKSRINSIQDMGKRVLVLTTINSPNPILNALGEGALAQRIPFIVVGDTKSPPSFKLRGSEFISLDQQDDLFPTFSRALPRGHYVRKNIGYLLAIQKGAEEIQETDDDNIPQPEFWITLETDCIDVLRTDSDWFNIYSLFTDEAIWPRGFPLEYINRSTPFKLESSSTVTASIQQGLADDNPDVDAIFRLTRQLPITFNRRRPVMLPPGVWCPFNSQNTIFKRAVFPLLYLPSRCSFRMTDIWRSFVAQRCLWEKSEGVVFHSATTAQERNEHSLLRDFEDEIPGYLLNDRIRHALVSPSLDGKDMLRSVHLCYEALANQNLIPSDELSILSEWEKALTKLL